jgi:hypothetical protein
MSTENGEFNPESRRYDSFSALKEAHTTLLKRYAEEESPQTLAVRRQTFPSPGEMRMVGL